MHLLLKISAIASFFAMNSLAFASDNPLSVESLRANSMESAIQGCSRAIEDASLASYMERAKLAGHPQSSEEEARAKIHSLPQWNDLILPAIRATCSCAFDAQLQQLRVANTEQEIHAVFAEIAKLQDSSNRSELEEKFASCGRENMKALPPKS